MKIDTGLGDWIEVETGSAAWRPWPVTIALGTEGGADLSQHISLSAARELRDALTWIVDEIDPGAEPVANIQPFPVLAGAGHPKFRDLLVEIWRDKHVRKAEGYGDSETGDLLANLRGSESVGIPAYLGAWIRSLDKDHRTNQAFKGGEPGPALWPKVRSDLLEKAAYCLLVIILFEEARGVRDPEAAA